VYSLVVGYDGSRIVKDEERSVWQRKPDRKQSEETKQSRWGFRGMTVRNWLELLIVPMVLVGIGLLFEMQQADRQQATEEQQQVLAEQRAQDEALQAYLNQMSGLLLERALRASGGDSEVGILARARTLTVLSRLDPSGKTALMQFLVDADLVDGRDPIISLRDADLREADLSFADLDGVHLVEADLREAELFGAQLFGADLRYADLRRAVLVDADLGRADLNYANLSGANLNYSTLGSSANLNYANLSGASLRRADLSNANLGNANLSDANLSNAVNWTEKQLMAARSLEGATMPNGQKYEDWLKSKNREEGGKNDGSS
jgi:uncharacterized protein YjbI with pentapeptide repeats